MFRPALGCGQYLKFVFLFDGSFDLYQSCTTSSNWMSRELKFLFSWLQIDLINFWDQSHITKVWNTRETGDIFATAIFIKHTYGNYLIFPWLKMQTFILFYEQKSLAIFPIKSLIGTCTSYAHYFIFKNKFLVSWPMRKKAHLKLTD